jgi:hypothetical protein
VNFKIVGKAKIWWSWRLKVLNKRKKFFAKQLKTTGLNIFRQLLKITRRHFKKVVKLRKREMHQKRIEDLTQKFLKDPNLFWKDMGAFRKDSKEVDIDLNTLVEHYKKVFNGLKQSETSLRLEKVQKEMVEKYANFVKSKKAEHKISFELMSTLMGQLKRSKKSGLSGAKNEMFMKAKNSKLVNYLIALFEMVLNEKCIPREMSMGLLITITKNSMESNKEVSNTRPITISEVISNLFENLIKNEFHKKANFHPCQYGFRKSSSCSHAIFTFNEMVEHAKRKKDNLFVFFLDYSKAFDRVNRVKLMYKLINVLPAHYWLALNNYYSTTKIRIQGRANEMSEPIETSIGTKQGGPFSPDAFNYYIDDLLIQLENTDHIYKIKNIPLGLIVYADDTTIACSTKKSAKSALNLVENYCDAHDILINESKTKWMCFNTNSKGPFEINGQALERVKQF